jgi:putative protease
MASAETSMQPPTIPELLAPAGTVETGLAAFKAGADAIYLGLQRFNARERGKNCSEEELARLVEYSRRKGKKVYLTLNTLVKETELPQIAELLCRIAPIRPHAVIVQDLGLLRMLRTWFPELTVHASTQMGLHNSAGIHLMQGLGVERVILQRQTTLEELQLILENVQLEVEVFVHGALCCGRSGSCLFSSWLGGWSGNRGKCKQPCRRLYRSTEKQGFFFSCQDLCLIDMVPAFKQLGIAALKIEGRLRPTAWVQRVVQAYRLMLDAPPSEEGHALREARRILAGAPGRKWSHGFLTPVDAAHVIDTSTPGTAGKPCARVIRTTPGGVLLQVTSALGIGDSLRIQPESGEEGFSFAVRNLSIDGKPSKAARPGECCLVACDVPAGLTGIVFKVAQAGTSPGDPEKELPAGRLAVPLEISVTRDRISIQIHPAPGVERSWRQEWQLAPAQKRQLSPNDVEAEFRCGNEGGFTAGTLKVEVEPGLFLPGSLLKSARRNFFEWLDTSLDPEDFRNSFFARLEPIYMHLQEALPTPEAPAANTIRCPAHQRGQHTGCIFAEDLFGIIQPGDEAILPEFVSEQEIHRIQARIEELIAGGLRRFRVTSWHGLSLLKPFPQAIITASFPLPVCNSLALEQLLELGVDYAMAWLELEPAAILDIEKRCHDRLQQYLYGRVPMLTTRAEIPAQGMVADLRGNRFEIIRATGLTTLYHEGVYAPQPIPGLTGFRDMVVAESAGDQGNTTRPDLILA